MWGQSKPVVLDRYGSRRRGRWLPRWLVLLLLGLAAGAAGVVYVQERHLPPRLSSDASARLTASYEQAERERVRLDKALTEATRKLDAALAEQKRLADELTASRASVEDLRAGVAMAVAALPPDPRGGAVEVRAARLAVKGSALAYELALSRGGSAKPMSGVLQISVTGDSGNGSEASTRLQPVAVTLGNQEVLRGSVPLPAGFRPRQAAIQVLDRPDGRSLGMRVLLVRE